MVKISYFNQNYNEIILPSAALTAFFIHQPVIHISQINTHKHTMAAGMQPDK